MERNIWRDGSSPCEWTGRTIYTGVSFDGCYCATDERDCLPPDLVTFAAFQWQGTKMDGTPMTCHGDELDAILVACEQTAASQPVSVSIGMFVFEAAGPSRYIREV